MSKDLISSFLPTAEQFPSRSLTLQIGATFGPFYVNFYASRPILVGTYSVDPDTDIFTLANHGMLNGTMVQVTSSSSKLTDGLDSGELYFVANANDNTFQLSTLPGHVSSSQYSVVNVSGSEPGRIYRCGTPYDMTDHKVWAWVKHSPSDADDDLILDLEPSITGADLGFGYDWRATFTKTKTQTFDLTPANHVWSFLIQFPSSQRRLLINNSQFIINLPTTHPDLIS